MVSSSSWFVEGLKRARISLVSLCVLLEDSYA